MRLRQLEVFYHVYREGSISDAARALHVSQPSVSKVLRHAEDQLGFPLFNRTKGRLYPTRAADQLFAEATDIYGRIESLRRTAENIRRHEGGHVRLGVLPSLGFSIVPDFIARMRREDAGMSFDLTTLHTAEIAEGLLERRFDMCLGFAANLDDRIAQCEIRAVELVLLARPGTIDAKDGLVDLAALDGCELIGLKDSGPVADLVASRLADAQVAPKEVVTAQTYYIAASLVGKGVGMAIVDRFTAEAFSDGTLTQHHFRAPMCLSFNTYRLKEPDQPELVEECNAQLKQLFG